MLGTASLPARVVGRPWRAAAVTLLAVTGVAGLPRPIAVADRVAHFGPVSPQAAAAYPYHDPTPVPMLDPWGFPRRECTSYVAWWLNTHGVRFSVVTVGPHGPALFGNATGWAAAARLAGFEVSSRPVVGAVAQWSAGERLVTARAGRVRGWVATGYGHVGVVIRVYGDGSVDMADYNSGDGHGFGVWHTRAPRYLYLGVGP